MMEMNLQRGIGSIVNICSVASKGGAPFILGYSCAKSALKTLTKNNAAELASKGIRVNGIDMGWCLTENENRLQSALGGEDWWKKADESVPLGRILRPVDVAASVLFLLSGASVMMTGSIIGELHFVVLCVCMKCLQFSLRECHFALNSPHYSHTSFIRTDLHPEYSCGMLSLSTEDSPNR